MGIAPDAGVVKFESIMNIPNKEDFVATLHKGIDDVSRKLDELRVQANLGKMEARDKMGDGLDSLDRKKAKVQRELQSVKESTGEAFHALADGCQKSWEEFRFAVEDAASRFKR